MGDLLAATAVAARRLSQQTGIRSTTWDDDYYTVQCGSSLVTLIGTP